MLLQAQGNGCSAAGTRLQRLSTELVRGPHPFTPLHLPAHAPSRITEASSSLSTGVGSSTKQRQHQVLGRRLTLG